MLAVIGDSPMAERLAALLAEDREVIRLPSPNGTDAEPRLSALAGLAKGPVSAAIAACAMDEASLIAASTARRLGARRSAAVVESPTLAGRDDLAGGLGIDRIINPEAEMAAVIAAANDSLVAAAVRTLGPGRVQVTQHEVGTRWDGVGMTLRELALPPGARIALVQRGDEAVVPGAETTLQAGDRVLMVANRTVAPAAAARLGAGAPGAVRVAVVHAKAGAARAARLVCLLQAAEVEARAAGPDEAEAAARGASVLVLLDAPIEAARRARHAAQGCPVFVIGSETKLASSTDVHLTPEAAAARAVRSLLPHPPIARLGEIVPERWELYRVEASDSAPWLGRPLRELTDLRGWIVLAIQARRNVHLPHPEDAIEPREVLLIAGPPDAEAVLERGLRGGRTEA